MLSNQILQTTIEGLRSITRRDISVLDRDGKQAAATDGDIAITDPENITGFIASPAESQVLHGNAYFKVFDNGVAEYVVAVRGDDEEGYRVGKIAAFQVQGLLVAYKERFDKDNFIKNLLLDNLLLVDIYSRAKKLHVENNVRRIVYLIETTSEQELAAAEIVRNLFPAKTKDFVTAVDENNIILVKELRAEDGEREITRHAVILRDTLGGEAMQNVCVAIGSPVNDLKNVSGSYKEAKMALEVGRIFEPDKSVMRYDKLGIGRLIYQLPVTLCKMFVNEVLKGTSVDQFTDEILSTVDKFFENNLNVSETSRQLFVHRNTLVYRLDKMQQLTGLDLRRFDDAITLKITLMVSKYMQYKEKFSY